MNLTIKVKYNKGYIVSKRSVQLVCILFSGPGLIIIYISKILSFAQRAKKPDN